MNKILELYKKYKKFILYIVFGVLTTLINLASYFIFSKVFKFGTVFSTCVAWLFAVLFAFVTNRKWVFDSKNNKFLSKFNELIKFLACRILTGILDVLIMYIFVDIFKLNDIFMKLLSNVIVIIANYFASKYLIFTNSDGVKNKNIIQNIIVYSTIFFLAVLFLFNSPLNIWQNGVSGVDSSVFKLIGSLIGKGYIPYRDLFDHKGPLIYIFNYLGTQIAYYRGTWIIELISLYVTFIFIYKIARLYLSKTKSIFTLLFTTTILFIFFDEGNLVEEYALPFLTASLYIFLEYFKTKKISNAKLVVCGACFSAVCLLRINMISLWVTFCILILVQCIINKQFKELLRFIIFFLIGFLIVFLPITIWLTFNGAFKLFIEDYIIFNLSYTSVATIGEKYSAFVYYSNYSVILATIIYNIFIVIKDKNDRMFNAFHLVYILLTLITVSMSGRTYAHYGMILLPCIIYPFVHFIFKIDKIDEPSIFKTFIMIYVLVTIICPPWLNTTRNIGSLYDNRKTSTIEPVINEVVTYIKDNSEVTDKISVYGNWDIIYILTKRMPASKYTYTYPIGDVKPEILDEYFEDIKSNKPKFIVSRLTSIDSVFNVFQKSSNYELVYKTSGVNKEAAYIYELRES